MAYPILIIDWSKYPELADNIWHAQMTGREKVLTYVGPSLGKVNRKEATHFELNGIRQEIMHLLSRDEYPFACSLEGGGASWIGHIPGGQNSAQGGLIAGFLRREGIVGYVPGGDREKSKFEVCVVNHPNGPVV